MLSLPSVSTNSDPIYIRVVKEAQKTLAVTEDLQFHYFNNDFHNYQLPTLCIYMSKLLFLGRLGLHSSSNSEVAKPCFRVGPVAWKLICSVLTKASCWERERWLVKCQVKPHEFSSSLLWNTILLLHAGIRLKDLFICNCRDTAFLQAMSTFLIMEPFLTVYCVWLRVELAVDGITVNSRP